jgi:hypothetical protein
MMKRLLALAIAFSWLSSIFGPAYAAERKDDDPIVLLQKEKKQDREAVDKQYQRALQETSAASTAPVKTDPWANMRGTTDAKKSK